MSLKEPLNRPEWVALYLVIPGETGISLWLSYPDPILTPVDALFPPCWLDFGKEVCRKARLVWTKHRQTAQTQVPPSWAPPGGAQKRSGAMELPFSAGT